MTVAKPKQKVITKPVTSASKLNIILSQPWTDGIQGVIYLFSKPMRSKSNGYNLSYFKKEMVWHKPKPIPNLVLLVNLINLLF